MKNERGRRGREGGIGGREGASPVYKISGRD